MGFIKEIYELLNVKEISSDMMITFMAGKGAVIQGYKKLLKISDEQIVVLGKNKRQIEVVGKNLEISSLAPSELVVLGKIISVGEYHE